MRITNDRINWRDAFFTIVSSSALLVSLMMHIPGGRFRNPPYHRFGGFDLGYWWAGWAIYGGQIVIAILLRRKQYGCRPILSVVIVVLILCILVNLASLLMTLGGLKL